MSKKSAAGSGKGKKKGVSAEPDAIVSQPNVVDNGTHEAVESSTDAADTGSASEGSDSGNHAAQNTLGTGRNVMDITLTKSNAPRKGDRLVIFNFGDGRRGSVQFQRSLFGDAIPDSLTLVGEMAEPKAPKAKETAEERKARLKALPKLTLAEKVAKAEERTAKLRAKLQAAELVTA